MPCVEIGWRLRRDAGGPGYATEAAEDLDHPNVPQGHPVQPHVLYRLTVTQSGATAALRGTFEPG